LWIPALFFEKMHSMDLSKEYFACLALRHTPKLTKKKLAAIVAHYGSAYEALHDAASWPRLELTGKTLSRSCQGEVWREKAEAEYKAAMQVGMQVLTWYDSRYPALLRQIHEPPLLLYYTGDISLLKSPGVAVVGARECTRLGLEAAGRISMQLSRIGITVISGLALGIDSQAHLGALQGVGSSIAVLGCGLDINYPPRNREVRRKLDKEALVVTEYGPGVEPWPGNFPYRNRIISGLSLGVLVAEAAHNSGSLITARLAGEQGRDVFALPGPIGQPTFTGCHRLIKQGAALVESASDIVEILRYDFARELEGVPDPKPVKTEEDIDTSQATVKKASKKKAKRVGKKAQSEKKQEEPTQKRPSAVERESMSLNDEEREIMTVLDGTDKMHIDALGRELSWDSPKVSKVLLILEMRGAVQQLPGMWYLAKES